MTAQIVASRVSPKGRVRQVVAYMDRVAQPSIRQAVASLFVGEVTEVRVTFGGADYLATKVNGVISYAKVR